MTSENIQSVTWEEARLHVFESFKTIKSGIDEIKLTMHTEFKSFKEEFARDNDLKIKEMREEIDRLKKNQFELLQKDKENDGKLKGKALVYSIIGTTVALLISVGGIIAEFLK